MSKLLVVFGATGQQGRSIVRNVLDDAELSKQYRIRAVTRDVSKPDAQELKKKGVEVVTGDQDDKQSVEKAVDGAHAVFLYTVSIYDRPTSRKEYDRGVTVADACVAKGVSLLIFSSTPKASVISKGKYKNNIIFEHPADIEAYIRTLPIKSAFVLPASFMQNLVTNMAPRPSQAGDGSYSLAMPFAGSYAWPFVDVDSDLGKFVTAILAAPDQYYGKAITAAENMYTFDQIVEILKKSTGKEVNFVVVPEDVFKGFLPPTFDTEMLEMMLYSAQFSYYGPDAPKLVAENRQVARGKLTTLEEFLTKNPLKLE